MGPLDIWLPLSPLRPDTVPPLRTFIDLQDSSYLTKEAS